MKYQVPTPAQYESLTKLKANPAAVAVAEFLIEHIYRCELDVIVPASLEPNVGCVEIAVNFLKENGGKQRRETCGSQRRRNYRCLNSTTNHRTNLS